MQLMAYDALRGKVDKIVSKSGRTLFLVHGSMAIPYGKFSLFLNSFDASLFRKQSVPQCRHHLTILIY